MPISAFLIPPSDSPNDAPMPFALRFWWLTNRLAAYCLLNLLDDPAILALAFC